MNKIRMGLQIPCLQTNANCININRYKYANVKFITVFVGKVMRRGSVAFQERISSEPIKSTPHSPILFLPILILISYLYLHLPDGLFPSVFESESEFNQVFSYAHNFFSILSFSHI